MSQTLRLNPVLPVKIKLYFSAKIFWVIVLTSLISLLFFYVTSISSLAQDYYSLKNHQKKLAVLEKENESLEIGFSRSNSLSGIGNYLNENFEKITSAKYIQIYPALTEKSALNYERLAD
jgi:hypothetical protein